MKPTHPAIVSPLLVASLLLASAAGAHEPANPKPSSTTPGAPPRSPAPNIAALLSTQLPPLPTGVAELKLSEFFKNPVGPRGLELTDKLQRLDQHRVRILGYMVRQERPTPRRFLLTSRPFELHEDEYGFCDDLPAAVIHVFTDPSTPAAIPFTPGPLLLTGTLSVGNRSEPDGRISSVRLQLDPPSPVDSCPDAPPAANPSTRMVPER